MEETQEEKLKKEQVLKELKKIKKVYGEEFMHLCRKLFPEILEYPGLLFETLDKVFANNSRTIGEDLKQSDSIEEFQEFIIDKSGIKDKEENKIQATEVTETPYELLEKAGYKLYECSSEKEIQKFKKFYKKGEELCTFNGGRLKKCVVFFAVKKDADKIKREDFKNPKRQDEYGTSVIGIQFNKKGTCNVSIKNRYNHTVANPDATFGNNLDKIIPGLTHSFKNMLMERGLDYTASNTQYIGLNDYIIAADGKYYKCNMEINGNYYCPGNIVIDYKGNVKKLENPEKQILIDEMVLDLEKKSIRMYDENHPQNGLIDTLQDIESIEVRKSDTEKNVKQIVIKTKLQKTPTIIEINNKNQIVGYVNNEITEIGDNFLKYSTKIKKFQADNVEKIGDEFLAWGGIEELNLPKVKKIRDDFLHFNTSLKSISAPNLESCGINFMAENKELEHLDLPKCKTIKNFTNIKDEMKFIIDSDEEISGALNAVENAIMALMETITTNLRNLNAPPFLRDNQEIKSIKLPKTLTSILIRRNIRKNAPNCEIELIDDKKTRSKKRNIKKPKLLSKKLIGSKQIAELDSDQKLTSSEVNKGKRIIDRVVEIFKGKNNEKQEK